MTARFYRYKINFINSADQNVKRTGKPMSGKQKIALISIGQTPRPDITTDYYDMGCDKFDITEFGALDGCQTKTIGQLAPLPGDADLVTRLADGSSVLVSHERLTPYVQAAVDRARVANVTVVVVQCTGCFALQTDQHVIYPAKVLETSAGLLAGNGKSVFLLTPTPAQTTNARLRWQLRGYTIAATHVIPPFGEQRIALESLQRDVDLINADAIIGDCYGFTNAFYQQLRDFYNGPILIPRRLIAQLLISAWQ